VCQPGEVHRSMAEHVDSSAIERGRGGQSVTGWADVCAAEAVRGRTNESRWYAGLHRELQRREQYRPHQVHWLDYRVPYPHAEPPPASSPVPDGLWFTGSSGNKIGRITPTGMITEFPIPTSNALRTRIRWVPTATCGSTR
jgi:streptogramin lyase